MLQPSCCNGFGLGQGFYVATKFVKTKGFLIGRIFLCRYRVAKVKRFYVMTENSMSQQSCLKLCRNKVAKAKRFYVVIENSMSRQSCLKLCRDKVYLTSRQRVPGHEVFHVAT